VASGEPFEPGQRDSGQTPGPSPSGEGVVRLRRNIPAQIRDVSFPVAVRGYDRRAVDAYVIRVNRLLAELEATRSPEGAVRHALEQVRDQAGAILERARERADEIVASARREAEETTARLQGEAADLVVSASAEADRTQNEAEAILVQARAERERILDQARKEATEQMQRADQEVNALRAEAEEWVRSLRTDTDAIWDERGSLLEDIHELTVRLEDAVRRADSQSPDVADEHGVEPPADQ
jgi:DivIVA domain-containing protein